MGLILLITCFKHILRLAEHGVYEVKRKLYLLMRHYRTKDWVRLLPDAVQLLNARPMTRNGGVPPAEINSFLQDPIIRSARLAHHIDPNEPDRKEEIKNEEQQKTSSDSFKVGSLVFLDKKSKVFDKSFELQVRRIYFFPFY